jgi:hypothetical protein
MAPNKKKEILRFAEWFLDVMSERCLKQCGGSLPVFHYPVFRKFLKFRVKREFRVYEECLRLASVLCEVQCSVSENDIDDVIRESIHIDNRLKGDVVLLPLRLNFDYDRILYFRRKRLGKQVELFKRLLSVDDADDYNDMVRKALSPEEFLATNNDLVELYTEEAFIINSSLTSPVKIDSEAIAQKMYCSMLDVGIILNREIAGTIYSSPSGQGS